MTRLRQACLPDRQGYGGRALASTVRLGPDHTRQPAVLGQRGPSVGGRGGPRRCAAHTPQPCPLRGGQQLLRTRDRAHAGQRRGRHRAAAPDLPAGRQVLTGWAGCGSAHRTRVRLLGEGRGPAGQAAHDAAGPGAGQRGVRSAVLQRGPVLDGQPRAAADRGRPGHHAGPAGGQEDGR